MLSLVCNSLFILELIVEWRKCLSSFIDFKLIAPYLFPTYLKTADSTTTPLDVIEILVALFACCIWMALFCEFGEMITGQFIAFNDDELSQLSWYLFSVELQRLLVIFMAFTQKPMTVRGSGNIKCTRESFKKVNEFPSNQNCMRLLYFLQTFLDNQRRFLLFYGTSSHSLMKCEVFLSIEFNVSRLESINENIIQLIWHWQHQWHHFKIAWLISVTRMEISLKNRAV